MGGEKRMADTEKATWRSSFFQGLRYGIFYPSSTIALRMACLNYVVPTGSKLPEWLHNQTDSLSYPLGEYGQIKPRLTALEEDHTIHMSILHRVIHSHLHPYRLVYEHEGLHGLFRGCTSDLVHLQLKDFLCTRVVYWCYPHAHSMIKAMSSMLQKSEDAMCECDDEKKDLESLSSSSPIIDTTHIMLRSFFEACLYPLFVIKNRIIIYEGPELLSFKDAVEYSYTFDGFFRGFYAGFPIYIASSLIKDSVNLACTCACKSINISHEDTDTIRREISSVLTSLLSPMTTLAMIQSTRSRMPGLCKAELSTSDILFDIPWNSVLISTLMTMTFSATTAWPVIKSISQKF